MLFNSLEFALFFPVTLIGFLLLRARLRWAWLLLASCVFYAAFIPKYLLILVGVILLDYCAGLLLERTTGRARRLVLAASLVANIGILALFKYFNFFALNTEWALSMLGMQAELPRWTLPLPIGLSFHTFQSMSYTIEVYRGSQKAERHLGIYALYVLFFPQLVAGPIERPQNLLHQLREPRAFDSERAISGLKLMMTGLLKKVVIADNLAVLVDTFYLKGASPSGPEALIATYAFAFQIFCDFSGYSDIARGSARILGYELMENFRRPYLAESIAEFWGRWHISLSTWFRDYLYIPLGGNRVLRLRWYANLMTVFIVSGFWHGASWTYLAWGALHGSYLVAAEGTRRWRQGLTQRVDRLLTPRVHKAWRIVATFHLTLVAWVFFRASSMDHALSIFGALGRGWGRLPRIALADLVLPFALVLALLIFQALEERRAFWDRLAAAPALLRWSVYYASVTGFLVLGSPLRKEFIYFQF